MGFFVLLGLIAYVVLAKFVVSAIGKYSASKAAKYSAIAVFVLIPTWDIVPGHLYFGYLCQDKARVRVHKSVEVEQKYFSANGQPNQKELSGLYQSGSTFDDRFSRLFHITKVETFVRDIHSGEILGSATLFHFYGGWLAAYLFPQGPPSSCPGYAIYDDLWKAVIKPKRNVQMGGI
ncbi:MAG: hypothetical protein AB1555_17810 [Nitrospirota bacterium]